MFLIVGLGNPGRRYENTRHNVGFMLVDRLAEAHGIKLKPSGSSIMGEGVISGARAFLLKPQTYMNLSGEAVVEFSRYKPVETGSIVALYDDCDLPLGRIRLRKGGSSGGHNGVKSLITLLGSDAFKRVRLGIGRPTGDTADYVLTPFHADERHEVLTMLDKGVESVETIIRDGIDAAMNRFN